MKWNDFWEDVRATDPMLLVQGEQDILVGVDQTANDASVAFSLERKIENNAAGSHFDSTVSLVKALPAKSIRDGVGRYNSVAEFAAGVRFAITDASPDTVIGSLALVARSLGVRIPPAFYKEWTDPIEEWDRSANVGDVDQSWVVLASSLAHSRFSLSAGARQSADQIALAWRDVVQFAAETVLAGDTPEAMPRDTDRPLLAAARSALANEKANYARKIHACRLVQLSVAAHDFGHPVLIDAVFTSEDSFAGGVFKALARKDETASPMGRGFALICVERPNLKSASPDYWMTIAADPSLQLDLTRLWRELERCETQAWSDAGRVRPPANDNSRRLAWLTPEDTVFDQPWYINQNASLVASPKRSGAEPDASLLDTVDVLRTICKVFDPLENIRITALQGAPKHRLTELPYTPIMRDDGSEPRRIVRGAWDRSSPLPLVEFEDPNAGLNRSIYGAMAARTLNMRPEDVIANAPHKAEFDVTFMDNGVAVVSAGGVFVMDAGRPRRASLDAACLLAKQYLELANELDELQPQISALALQLSGGVSRRISMSEARAQRKECVRLQMKLVGLRSTFDRPLASDEADLARLRATLSARWNIAERLDRLLDDIDRIAETSDNAEEIRIFRTGQFAAGVAIIVLLFDALRPIEAALAGRDDAVPLFNLGVVALVAFGLVVLAAWLFRSRL